MFKDIFPDRLIEIFGKSFRAPTLLDGKIIDISTGIQVELPPEMKGQAAETFAKAIAAQVTGKIKGTVIGNL